MKTNIEFEMDLRGRPLLVTILAVQPAEHDVGIMSPYVEDVAVKDGKTGEDLTTALSDADYDTVAAAASEYYSDYLYDQYDEPECEDE